MLHAKSGVLVPDAGEHKRWDLQLFTGEGASSGGDGGDGSSTAGAEASGQSSMDSLGIPKDKLERYNRAKKARQVQAPRQDDDPPEEQPAPKAQQAAAAAEPEQQDPSEPAGNAGLDFDEALKNPEFNQRIQDIVQKRVANMRGVLDTLAPALETLGQKYGLDVSDMSKLDYKALADAINEDDSFFENKAEEMGSSPETARRVFQAELAEKRKDQTIRDEMMNRHFAELERQAVLLKQKIPEFDLRTEMQDPRFQRMVMPGGGWNVEQAFNAIHHDAIMKAAQESAAKAAAQAISNSVASGKNIPAENGSVQRSAGNARPKLYSEMTPEERAAYKERITGRKPYGR